MEHPEFNEINKVREPSSAEKRKLLMPSHPTSLEAQAEKSSVRRFQEWLEKYPGGKENPFVTFSWMAQDAHYQPIVAALKAEVEELKSKIAMIAHGNLHDYEVNILNENQSLRKQIEQLTAELADVTKLLAMVDSRISNINHASTCDPIGGKPCTCGLDEFKQAYKKMNPIDR